ncbi:hypothetical protein [Pararhizobium sp. IMCC21322]|uniref:hypothetical protein n=1 Tax=Pararhizobium sp. IMCC21322 TaxID=3067903 RepID=UPI0027410B8D|nr:hypothetical protein [Pararhizobium sp. IMCC21322]
MTLSVLLGPFRTLSLDASTYMVRPPIAGDEGDEGGADLTISNFGGLGDSVSLVFLIGCWGEFGLDIPISIELGRGLSVDREGNVESGLLSCESHAIATNPNTHGQTDFFLAILNLPMQL